MFYIFYNQIYVCHYAHFWKFQFLKKHIWVRTMWSLSTQSQTHGFSSYKFRKFEFLTDNISENIRMVQRYNHVHIFIVRIFMNCANMRIFSLTNLRILVSNEIITGPWADIYIIIIAQGKLNQHQWKASFEIDF